MAYSVIKQMRLSTHLTQSEIAEYYRIPLNTFKSWEADKDTSDNARRPPDYLVGLLARVIMSDFYIDSKVNNADALFNNFSDYVVDEDIRSKNLEIINRQRAFRERECL